LTGTVGSFLRRLEDEGVAHGDAMPNIHIGIMAGKLNGVMPAQTPSGWRIE
jgi:allophanate hydrolase subunit 1